MSGQANVLSNSVTPLIDRILANPLTFISGKQIESDNFEKPASYIVLSKSSKKGDSSESSKASTQEKEPKSPEMRKPRSMAEAVAVYTGKKFLTKAEKKAAKKRKVTQPLVDSEEEDVGEVIGGDIKMAESDSDSISDSQYESASEFQSDSNVELPFAEFKSESDVKSSSESRSDSELKTESESKSDSESTSESPAGGEEDDEGNDDDDDDDNKDYSLEDNESFSESDSGSASDVEDSSNDEEDLEALKHDLKQELQHDPRDISSKDPSLSGSDDDDEEKEEENSDKNTTPPTSPEDEPEKPPATVNASDDLHVLPLNKFYSINEVSSDRGSNNSTRIYKNWRELSKRKPVGLLNHGVTCYMNSAIQSLIHIPAVQHYLTDINSGKHNKTLKPRSVSHVLAELSKRMWALDDNTSKAKQPKYVNPKRIIQRLDDINCMMSEWQQEDSHEYFMSLMSRLQEDSTPKGVKLNQSIIYDIFGGLLHQSVTCKNCNYVSDTKQEFYDLSLGLNRKKNKDVTENSGPQRYTIEKSIQEFFSSELIKLDRKDKSSGYDCENCKQKSNACKISTIDRSPETLTVHLKRFKFNGNSSSKVKQSISYPNYLDLTKFTTLKTPTKYQLVSVIVHEGRSISSGHYIAHCLQPDGTWSTYDDEYINKINEKEALSDPSAYVLVYTKLTPRLMKRSNEGNDNLVNAKKLKR
ncbi:DEHA2F03520p [Debaryomyces hansenii CBS767]|uniref:ubiquitinyl hydrolase 1 n=1 Tax=Debaryomyces hansenii (strain ATCC 36239 / CBS 767 / BCRC 21394 / JCM 1990 / NBRC 0083 / IGC 2968) TaxID=284592 RepID=Q6BMQ2_DEBHA|nr:DEHA2F03520p [Debaryomyces hansenii CBS767]CAG88832.2 DEHA2F03520p [Debaryomyces hansenii CBS767]|eukprot:XP_460519.2 DEHA2F03520p [Debaryomyces hansenii CBS767]